LKIPVAVQPNRLGDIVYVSQHGEDAIFSFDTNTQSFTRYLIGNDTRALPFGMTLDNDGYLWIAEHTLDKIAVFDPKTGSSQQVLLQDINPLTQWITTDSNGQIWLAEPGSATLALVKSGK
jgi:copper transport protein